MKLTVKTLKGSHFEIKVQPSDTVMAVKKNIEEVQGKDNYPWGQQLLIHNGKVLKDETTLEENKIGENGFLVVMLSKSKTPAASAAGASSAQPSATTATPTPVPQSTPAPTPAPPSVTAAAPPQDVPPVPAAGSGTDQSLQTADAYGQAASQLVAGNDMEQTVQQLLDMGGGNWDRETVLRALRAAYNNPERAVDYLYSGIPETAEVAVPVARFPSGPPTGQGRNTSETPAAGTSPVPGIPNTSPLDLFPQGMPGVGTNLGAGSLEFLRDNPQFQQLRAMVQANPQILQPMLLELSKQNPQLLRLIQEHHTEFLQLLNDNIEGGEGDLFEQADQEMAHSISVTPEEQEAITRLEAMGFERSLVIEAFLACDRNEQLAANFLLEHAGEDD